MRYHQKRRHQRENPVLGDWWSSLSMNEKIVATAGGLGALGVCGYLLYNYLNYGTVTGMEGVVAPGGGGGAGGGTFVGSQGGSPTTSASSIMGSIGSSVSSFFNSIENALGIGGGGGPSTTSEAVSLPSGGDGTTASGDVASGDDSGGVSSEGAGAWLESTTTPEELAQTEAPSEGGITVPPFEISGTPGSETVGGEETTYPYETGTYAETGEPYSTSTEPGAAPASVDIGDIDSGDDATYAGEV